MHTYVFAGSVWDGEWVEGGLVRGTHTSADGAQYEGDVRVCVRMYKRDGMCLHVYGMVSVCEGVG